MPLSVTVTRDAIVSQIAAALETVLAEHDVVAGPLTEATRLLGREAPLDSLGLVTFVIELEDRLHAAYGVSLSLTHERALSRQQSPFLTIGTLADYTAELLGGRPTPAS